LYQYSLEMNVLKLGKTVDLTHVRYRENQFITSNNSRRVAKIPL